MQQQWGDIWKKIQDNLLKTIRISKWLEDLKCDMQERPIFQQWNLCLTPAPTQLTSRLACASSPTHWQRPPWGFLRLNFDGASKGNPDPKEFGVVFRNDQGLVLFIMVGSIRYDTNNATELWVLIRGIQAATSLGYQKLLLKVIHRSS